MLVNAKNIFTVTDDPAVILKHAEIIVVLKIKQDLGFI
jgi:hypothetical protein